MERVARHYGGRKELAEAIRESLRRAGHDLDELTTADLASVDEFHVRGRQATLELAKRMRLKEGSEVLDIGSGLGGPARTVAERYRCKVIGIDLTPQFCEAAATLSDWVGLGERVRFEQGDATSLPFEDDRFDAAMTIHVAMNIPDKDKLYAEAYRVLKPGAIFAVYDILQGEGGRVHYPVPWARDPSISHLATTEQMRDLLEAAGFAILEIDDTTKAGQAWFEAMAERMAAAGAPPVTFQAFLGNDFPTMAKNLVRNLTDRRIRTVSFICEA